MINPVKVIVGYSVLMTTVIVSHVGFYALMPTSFWFEYESVQVEGYVPPDGPVSVVSRVNRYRETNMSYSDVLRCDVDGKGFQFYSIYKSEWPSGEPSDEVIISRWKYHGRVPKTGRCYIRSATSAMGIFGVLTSPPDIQESNIFTIGETNGTYIRV